MSVTSSYTESTSSSSLSQYPRNANILSSYYSGHLQPSYRRYTSYDPLITANAGSLVINPQNALPPSSLELRKQNASKLKGLVIPEQPVTLPQPAVSKTLPTIISSTSSSTDLFLSKPEEATKLTRKDSGSSGTNGLTSSAKNWSCPPLETSTVLSEPPWMSARSTVPKYSPAFKRRALELPRSLSSHSSSGSSASSTSAVASPTTPLSPTSFVTTTSYSANKLEGLFQFSLSHSKPIVPLLPETASSRPTQPRVEAISSTKFISNSLFDLRPKQEAFDSTLLSTKNGKNNSSFCLNEERKEEQKLVQNSNLFTNESKTDGSSSSSEIALNVCVNFDEASSKKTSDSGSLSTETVNCSNTCECDGDQEEYKSSMLSPDNSDDESSLLSHKTSDASSNKADDSAYETLSDSFERTLSPEIRRPKELSLQRTVLKNSSAVEASNESKNMDSVKNFRALAEKWEQRVCNSEQSRETNQRKSTAAPPLPPKPKDFNRIPPSLQPRNNKIVNETQQESFAIKKIDKEEKEQHLASSSSAKPVAEPKKKIDTSLWESSGKKEKVASSNVNNTAEQIVPTTKNKIIDNQSSVPSKTSAILGAKPSRSMSVSDICKVFEVLSTLQSTSSTNLNQTVVTQKQQQIEENVCEGGAASVESPTIDDKEEEQTNKDETLSDNSDKQTQEESLEKQHLRMSSLDSTASDSGTQSGPFDSYSAIGSRASSVSNLRDSQYGSITSLASTTSLISPQELQHLIEEANQSLEGEISGHNAHNIQVVVLHREYLTSGSIGITLAGGVDYETKEITVHKVISGSIADRDGRIKKGDRILSINGKILKGLTHREALNILKSPRPEVVLVLSRPNGNSLDSINGYHSRCHSVDFSEEARIDFRTSRSKSEDILNTSSLLDSTLDLNSNGDGYKVYKAVLVKDGAGLGFILEGGKDSPLGDKPLALKRVFKGGPADKEGTLMAGDEIVSVNDYPVHNMTRTEAWNFLKKLGDGEVTVIVRRKVYSSFA
ncbi:uncharacterized protein B4U79_01647 [Dinothrombium tinctorium]|uniref:PDZ domain-containing protein n=1 Tax=Dinothrombium tinctorium TaxID=1965070 RepID=A0A443QSN8_9ACAR|nr:uncharacterized protein B4U79_01647 [Dinothrombium tinctorium]